MLLANKVDLVDRRTVPAQVFCSLWSDPDPLFEKVCIQIRSVNIRIQTACKKKYAAIEPLGFEGRNRVQFFLDGRIQMIRIFFTGGSDPDQTPKPYFYVAGNFCFPKVGAELAKLHDLVYFECSAKDYTGNTGFMGAQGTLK